VPEAYPRAGVSIAVFREGDVLLVQRGKPPYEGFWSLPGGAVQWGESAKQAALRELKEETGLLASDLSLGDVVDAIHRDSNGTTQAHYLIVVFGTRDVLGEVTAADDVRDAGWFSPDARTRLKRTPGLETAIEKAKLALDKRNR
jgi:ADP-ribose pyrophosphatase YjhB (NUDIX family)